MRELLFTLALLPVIVPALILLEKHLEERNQRKIREQIRFYADLGRKVAKEAFDEDV